MNDPYMTEAYERECIYQEYLYGVALGLHKRHRLYLIKEKRKIQRIIDIYQQALKGPYAHKIRREDITEFYADLRSLQKELERLCD